MWWGALSSETKKKGRMIKYLVELSQKKGLVVFGEGNLRLKKE